MEGLFVSDLKCAQDTLRLIEWRCVFAIGRINAILLEAGCIDAIT